MLIADVQDCPVIPTKGGIPLLFKDSCFRRNDRSESLNIG
ncbi:Uncharacterized protein dnm_089820 [Desulfonema magnum]|uniref:Uncharacterized protein n=1 Tax=Desulfonema magnum TaxID=45655 RepID=A0A975BXC9_9BACT|nr:Uncharacterized protein dnm_089820 [Desulfonema magnum]